MKNLSCVGLCWAMVLGLVAVALGQQQAETHLRNEPQSVSPTLDTTGMPVEQALPGQPTLQKSGPSRGMDLIGEPVLPAPEGPNVRRVIEESAPAGRLTIGDGQRRGELGVWMGDSGGRGVRVMRVAGGSAAEKAGLRAGDVILQVNGQGISSPQETARLIRQIPIGESANLTLWRDGNEQQLQVTMQPGREIARDMVSDASPRAGFGQSDSADSDLASRTARLEQQLNALTLELAAMKQELAQLRSTGPVQTGFNATSGQGAPPLPPQDRSNDSPKPATTSPPNPVPPAGLATPEEKPAKPTSDSSKLVPPTATPPASTPEKSPTTDLFSPDAAQPKGDATPKADNKGGSDDLFK